MTADESMRRPGNMLWPARLVSVLFHPLLVGVLMATYMIFGNPDFFIGMSTKLKVQRWIAFTNNTVVYMLLVVLLLRGLGFTKSVLMPTQRERIVPLMVSVILYFWTWLVFHNLPDVPLELSDMCFGMFLSASAGMMLNSFYKISLHGIGVGGMMGLMVVLLRTGHLQSALPIAASILITGAVCTARLADSDHRSFDIVTGLLVGFFGQLVSHWI
jgi:hypothetical protein